MDSIEREKFLLGWFLWQPSKDSIKRELSRVVKCRTVELKNKSLLCCIELPELSAQEASLLSGAFEEFKKSPAECSGQECIEEFLEDCCEKSLAIIDWEQKKYITEYLRLMAFGYGPLSVLLENPRLEEIAITGVGREKPVRVFDCRLGWIATNFYYCSESEIKNAVNRMSSSVGKRVSIQSPRLNAVLPDGSRLSCSINPVSFLGPSVTLRKFRREPFRPEELVENRTASPEAMAFMKAAFATDCNVMIAGNTGSGKTSTLNSLFSFVPRPERIIVVEETPELNIRHEHLVKLNVSEGLNVSMTDLIVDSLRMRPDRVVVGEIRNEEEVGAFVDTMLAGQGRGSYCTFHAQSSREAFSRLKRLGVMDIDIVALDLLVVQKRWVSIGERAEKRKIVEVSEILEKDGKPEINTVFEFDYRLDELLRKNESIKVREKFEKASGFAKGSSFSGFLESEAESLERLAEKTREKKRREP